MKLASLNAKLNDVTEMMASKTDEESVKEVQEKMLRAWSNDELNKVGGTPAFIVALCIVLQSSIVGYAIGE